MSNSFDKLHEQLSILRAHAKNFDDPRVEEFVTKMEFGLLAPMRQLRLSLEIPYDWHEKKEEEEESEEK